MNHMFFNIMRTARGVCFTEKQWHQDALKRECKVAEAVIFWEKFYEAFMWIFNTNHLPKQKL